MSIHKNLIRSLLSFTIKLIILLILANVSRESSTHTHTQKERNIDEDEEREKPMECIAEWPAELFYKR